MPLSPTPFSEDELKQLQSATTLRLVRASSLMLVLLAAAFCGENWEAWHRLSHHVSTLPVLAFPVVTAVALCVYLKMQRLQNVLEHACAHQSEMIVRDNDLQL